MAGIRTTLVDDNKVGQSSGEFFSPNAMKQRIALVPGFMTLAEVTATDEMQKKAQAGDESALEELQYFKSMKDNLEKGSKKQYPTVISVENDPLTGKGGPGWLFPRFDSHETHYQEGFGSFLCKKAEYEKKGLTATCCSESAREAYLSYACLVVVYQTDQEGNILRLSPEAQISLDDKHKLDFTYAIKRFNLSDPKIREWKKTNNEYPLVSVDYHVWTEKQGKSDRIKFAPCRDCQWQTKGPVLFKQILKEAAPQWKNLGPALGKDLSLSEIDALFGKSSVPAGGGQQVVAQDFSKLLEG